MNVTKMYKEKRNKSLMSIGKILQNEKKRLIIKNNDLESSFEAINLLQQAYLDEKNQKLLIKNL